jgi:hypothetical protein
MAAADSRPYSGRVKRRICERLHDSRRDLADVLDVPAKRWRTPIEDVVERQRRAAWLAMMRDLAAGDQFLMKEAIDIGLLVRSGRPEDDLTALLAQVPVNDATRRSFAAARRWRRRVIGGASSWPELAGLYHRSETR